ncbi:MAG: hypothetical protein EOP45_21240, partial [Sphingobacteriaceae bacterium]
MESKILKIKLAETYIKVKQKYNEEDVISIRNSLVRATEEELILRRRIQRINNFLKENSAKGNTRENLENIYESSITCIVNIEEGSIKGKVTFYGSFLFLFYNAIGSYGDFRSGLSQLKEDVTDVSEFVINRTTSNNSIVASSLERTERRTGLVGRLLRTLDRIDSLQNQLHGLSNDQIEEELARLRQDLANIIELLPQNERTAILSALPPSTKNN